MSNPPPHTAAEETLPVLVPGVQERVRRAVLARERGEEFVTARLREGLARDLHAIAPRVSYRLADALAEFMINSAAQLREEVRRTPERASAWTSPRMSARPTPGAPSARPAPGDTPL